VLQKTIALVLLLFGTSHLRAQTHAGLPARANPSQAKADICTDPYAAICGGSPPQVEVGDNHILNDARLLYDPSVKSVLKLMRSDLQSRNIEAFKDKYFKFMAAVQKAIINEFEKRGINEEMIRARISKNQVALSRALDGPARRTLESVSLVMADELRERDSPQTLQDFYLVCGIDGLSVNAVASSNLNDQFIVCPGFLLQLLNRGVGLEGLDFAVAHEMSHSVDQYTRALPQSYSNFLKCLRKSQIQLASPEQVAGKIVSDTQRKSFNSEVNGLVKLLGESADASLAHSRELFADAMAANVLTQSLPRKPVSEARRSFSNALSSLCIFGQDVDDGLHPSALERMRFIVDNPTIGKALGCKVSTPPKVWCEPK
jgi:hypothetical protein